MKIYGLKSCDTCRKARKALPDAAFFDLRDTPLDADLLSAALETFGTALVNTRSTTWRGLEYAIREKPATELLRTYPALMKRPLIVAAGKLYLGWSTATRAELGVA